MESVSTQVKYAAVTTRFLSNTEKRYQSCDAKSLLVIEPKPGLQKTSFFCEFLSSHSESVVQAIYEHGAVLFRGFEVADGEELTQVTRSIKGLQPLSGYFIEERGRIPVKGSSKLCCSNRYVECGGLFKRIGGASSENYPHADVPAFQSLWWRRDPCACGETAVLQIADMCDELDESLRMRLEQKIFDSRAITVSDTAQRYATSEPVVETLCAEAGLPIESHNGYKFEALCKPSVFRHLCMKLFSVKINLSVSLPGFEEELRRLLEPHYRSLGWNKPLIYKLPLLDQLEIILLDPAVLWVRLRDPEGSVHRGLTKLFTGQSKRVHKLDGLNAIGSVVTQKYAKASARAAVKNLPLFGRKRGDLLSWDNITMSHA